MRAWSRGKLTIFQSTLSVRRATWRPLTMEQSEAISIHALRKESDFGFRGSVAGKHISIHALRKESDAYCGRIMSPCSAFQSTLSVRRATQRILDAGLAMEFQSTLSVRRATFTPTLDLAVSIFQSTLSVRRATHDGHSTVGGSIFQSTLSVRRATPEHPPRQPPSKISIHALRKESDRQSVFCHRTVRISIHALRKESDACRLAGNGSVLISIHALRKESDWSCGRRFRR